MKFNEVKYLKRKNLGNYEHEEVTLSAFVDEGEEADKVLTEIKNLARKMLDHSTPISVPASAPREEKTPEAVSPTSKEDTKDSQAKAEASPSEEPNKKAKPKSKPKSEAKSPSDEDQEKSEEKEPAKEKSYKAKAGSPTPYNRGSDLHKKLVVDLLNANVSDWKTKSAKVTQASQAMGGKDFLSPGGGILESFKTEFLSHVNQ